MESFLEVLILSVLHDICFLIASATSQDHLGGRIMELEEAAKDIRYEKKDKEKHLNHHKEMLRQCNNRLVSASLLHLHLYDTLL